MTFKEGKRKRVEQGQEPRKRTWWKQDLAIILFFSLLLLIVAWILNRAPHRAHARTNAPRSEARFGPTIANSAPAPEVAPEGMVWIPGGEFSMGANDPPDMDDVGMKATSALTRQWRGRPRRNWRPRMCVLYHGCVVYGLARKSERRVVVYGPVNEDVTGLLVEGEGKSWSSEAWLF